MLDVLIINAYRLCIVLAGIAGQQFVHSTIDSPFD